MKTETSRRRSARSVRAASRFEARPAPAMETARWMRKRKKPPVRRAHRIRKNEPGLSLPAMEKFDVSQLELPAARAAAAGMRNQENIAAINFLLLLGCAEGGKGYILRVSEDLLDVMISTTGRLPHVFALSQQDITPYGNGLYHLNSILQPATATKAPVVGVAVTTETTVAGCATGATHLEDLEDAGRFMLEAAKAFGNGLCSFYDEEEFGRIQKLYGSMEHFQTLGKQ